MSSDEILINVESPDQAPPADVGPPNTANVLETDFGWPGFGPFKYHILCEPRLSSELERLSFAKELPGNVHAVSLQPCPNPEERSQDRYAVEEWELTGGKWMFMAVFDGHAGHETVDYAVSTLPSQLKAALQTAIEKSDSSPSPDTISTVISDTLVAFDDTILAGLNDVFPGGAKELEALSDEEIKARVNDTDRGGQNNAKVLRCMRGSTALLALSDPASQNLWVASLGDCAAVLGEKDGDGWKATILSSNHNGKDEDEVARTHSEHPNEPEAVLRDRILGAIAVTRALGDHCFKLPQIYTRRVFLNMVPGFQIRSKVEEFIPRNLTPPYVSKYPSLKHFSLTPSSSTSTSSTDHSAEPERVLVMASDGLVDLYDAHATFPQAVAEKWVRAIGGETTAQQVGEENLALRLLRNALGEEDVNQVSAFLTAEMSDRCMDDTTVLVRRL